ncbi:CYFA0S04e01970g1_1 [Cyberlindnera fabianii]|uniref:Glutamate decarboxylase n=1 Tax=Cyberlindnera fabianii TaxID=36022 RepID=A0A061AQY4_CYBFA|nr:Glutamate decarboxylase [Cyberlindnera fabianii]CDR40025.1 CYFA0S04e01970g1_1 [Cyberlindnera fabianii]
MLSSAIDAEKLEESVFSTSHYHNRPEIKRSDFITQNKYELPKDGIDGNLVYNLLHNDLSLDGNPTLNLASFVNTFSGIEARKLAEENLVKNLADADEYPTLMDITERNISMLGKLWGGESGKPVGTATTGSSEAIMLGGLALKKRWQAKRKEQGKDISNPNIIMGSNAQVALEKFARYFDVEPRLIPVTKESNYVLDLNKIEEQVDENTIGVFVIMGSTYTGSFENVLEVNNILDKIHNTKGYDVSIHVDGASGAFIAPFLYPELVWDFRVPRVVSINTSGHKFGLTSAGLGWVLWRDSSLLPQELIFKLRYLGGVEESFNLNFSRPGFQSIHQYFNFLNLGFNGFKDLHHTSLRNARVLSNCLEKTEYFDVVSLIHRKKGVLQYDRNDIKFNIENQDNDDDFFNSGLPVVAFKFTDVFKEAYPNIPQSIVSTLLRKRGWIIPNYPLPPTEEDTEILRVVVRVELTDDLLHRLITDIVNATESLIKSYELYNKSVETTSLPAKRNYIYQFLNSIASGGGSDASALESFQEHKENHHSTYKGTC